jgi:ATP-dependent Clp protease ATP-binding subunit ClpC
MPEAPSDFIPDHEVLTDETSAEIRELMAAVRDVARRLNHNVLALEHLLVVGAENGVEEMARTVPSLTAFREALLDSLFDDRDAFRYQPKADDETLFFTASLAALVKRLGRGETTRDLLVETMLSEELPRIRKALDYARGNEPEVVPPDTITLDALDDTSDAVAEHRPAEAGPKPPTSLPFTVNLGVEAREDPPLVRRELTLEQVGRILLRFHEPAVLLVGAPGSGKTSFVRGLARGAEDGSLPALAGFHFFQLKLLDLVTHSHRGQDVHNVVDQILQSIATDPTGVLVIDDLHLLVAKQGYPLMSDLIDTIKLHITRSKVRTLLTVDSDAYQKSFGNDTFFTSQITVKQLPLLEKDALEEVVGVFRERLEKHFGLPIDSEALQAAVDASLSEESPEFLPPGSTIRLLDEACAMARSELAETVTEAHVHRCFSDESQEHAHPDRERLKSIETRLMKRVLGQDVAANAVARRVRLAKMHMDRRPERPDGVFLFLGPSGVGKTAMARALARALYDDESRLVRLDMSEYMEPHSVARIIGAPPGYVGYGENGALTHPVSELGHCVVLLDEVEKAHPRVLNLFLQVFDDGRLTDSKGRLVNFSDTVIIMTSNIGRELYAIHGQQSIGFGAAKDVASENAPLRDVVQDHLLRVLPSEFVNRIDEIVPFRVLEEDDIVRIARILLEGETDRWHQRGKQLVFDDDIPRILALTGYDPRLGARHVERNLERLVISLITEAAVTDQFESITKLGLTEHEGVICLELDDVPFQCVTRHGEPAPGLDQADPPRGNETSNES